MNRSSSTQTWIVKSIAVLLAYSITYGVTAAGWKPAENPLMTRWAKDVKPAKAHPEYPRPQMERKEWQNLNGLWDFEIMANDDGRPQEYSKKILVPFCVESALSGVKGAITERDRMWYRREFTIPSGWKEKRVLLHFGAVDWDTTVYVNGKEVERHKGGYDPFVIDITDVLKEQGEQELVVSVWDPGNRGGQPVGKQALLPGTPPSGIFYTRVSGIWRTVWLEAVAQTWIKSFKAIPDIDKGELTVKVDAGGTEADKAVISAVAFDGKKKIAEASGPAGEALTLQIPDAKLWTPDTPFLYDLTLTLTDKVPGAKDQVGSYFGMRKISLGKDESGITRLMLNNTFVFQVGPLDQGYWPDGLYTAPTDEALKFDLDMTKKYGFNMIRKHVKVEPERWYYWCDKLGILVWQDMPSGNNPTPELKRNYETELSRMISTLYNHPCIVMWVPFNEGWGQFDTERIVDEIKKQDSTRLVDNASGWVDKKVGDVMDIHSYPGPASPRPEENRAAVLGEFGGLGFNAPGHTWAKTGWGYALLDSEEALNERYEGLYRRLHELIKKPGLSAAVYTQTTDIEAENNGLMSYDRELIKINPAYSALACKGVFPPACVTVADVFIDTINVTFTNDQVQGTIQYTRDGTDPEKDSPVYAAPLTLSKTTTIKARLYLPDGTASRTKAYTFEKVKPSPARKVDKLLKGIQTSYYEGSWQRLPDFDGLKAKKESIAMACSIDPAERNNNFALVFDGYISVPETGVYIFYCTSDDGSRLVIDGQEVVENDRIHGMTEKGGTIALEKGLHAYRLEYFQGTGGQGLQVEYEGPGIPRRKIPAEMLFHQ